MKSQTGSHISRAITAMENGCNDLALLPLLVDNMRWTTVREHQTGKCYIGVLCNHPSEPTLLLPLFSPIWAAPSGGSRITITWSDETLRDALFVRVDSLHPKEQYAVLQLVWIEDVAAIQDIGNEIRERWTVAVTKAISESVRTVGNMSEVARRLGVTRAAVYMRLRLAGEDVTTAKAS